MSLRMDPERAQQVGRRLLDAFRDQGIFGKTSMPAHVLPQAVERGSREHLHFVTLTTAINYMRDSDALWEASRRTYADPKTRYLYTPRQVAQTDAEKLIADMKRYRLAKKSTKDADIWQTICITLTRHFDGDVYNLLNRANFDACLILETIRDRRYQFPYIKGPKIGPLWIRVLEDRWQGHHLDNLDHVPIPVDTHIAEATVMTGCVRGPFDGPFSELQDAVTEAWFTACQGSHFYALLFNDPLWHLSRRGCRKTRWFPCEYWNLCPVTEYCTEIRPVKKNSWISIAA
ncbi:MAG TPA: hypothetical protein ENN19_04535 [Chloroflexi bacterium]|nr:hypothetical protein [Chloroflexota bacterium]